MVILVLDWSVMDLSPKSPAVAPCQSAAQRGVAINPRKIQIYLKSPGRCCPCLRVALLGRAPERSGGDQPPPEPAIAVHSLRTSCGFHQGSMPRSLAITLAELYPGAPVMLPPGWQELPQR